MGRWRLVNRRSGDQVGARGSQASPTGSSHTLPRHGCLGQGAGPGHRRPRARRLAGRVVEQIRRRFAGEKITDRLVSLLDTDARPVRRGKLAQPNEFGYVMQAELTQNTQKGALGLLLRPKLEPGSTHGNTHRWTRA